MSRFERTDEDYRDARLVAQGLPVPTRVPEPASPRNRDHEFGARYGGGGMTIISKDEGPDLMSYIERDRRPAHLRGTAEDKAAPKIASKAERGRMKKFFRGR